MLSSRVPNLTRRVVPLVVLASLAVAAHAAAADPGVAFRETGTLELKAADLPEQPPNALCNATGRRLSIHANATALKLTSGANHVTLTVKNADGQLDPGTCRTIELTLPDPAEVKDGKTYKGVLTVVTPAGIARRDVSLAGADVTPESVVPKAAQDEVTLKATRPWPWSDPELEDDALPVKPVGKDQELALPKTCDASGKPASSTTPPSTTTSGDSGSDACLLGSLYHGPDRATVSLAGVPDGAAGFVPVRVVGADEIGDYSGALDLAKTPDDAADDIKVKVTVIDGLRGALLAVLIGMLLSLFPQYVARRWLPKHRLMRDARAFPRRYASAIKAAHEGDEPQRLSAEWLEPSNEELKSIKKDVKTAIKRYGRSTFYFDTGSDAYKEVRKSVDLVNADIDVLANELALALATLAKDLDDLVAFIATRPALDHAPPFVARASAVLAKPTPTRNQDGVLVKGAKEGRLGVGEAAERARQAAEWSALTATWREHADTALTYSRWAGRLAKAWDDADDPWPARDVERLRVAVRSIGEALHELGVVKDAKHLASLNTAAELDAVYAQLALLSGQYGCWPSASNEGVEPDPAPLQKLGFAASDRAVQALKTRNLADSAVPASLGGDVVDVLAYAPVVLDSTVAFLLEGGAVLTTVAVSVIAALSAFYFGKTWGTLEDYLTVIAATAVVQTGLQAVLDLVGRLLPEVPEHLIVEGPLAALLKREKADEAANPA